MDSGLVCSTFSRPPNGMAAGSSAPYPPAQTIPIMPFTAASSTYSPSRPMWFDCTIPTTATFCVRAFSMATSIAYFAAT